jgi:hypothetical protein
MHFLDEDSVALDGTTVIVQSKSISSGVFIVVEDKFFTDEASRLEGHPKLV